MATDFVTAEELTLITNDFADLVADTQVRTAITYKVFVSKGTFDPATGKETETFTSLSINSFKYSINEEEINASGGKYQLGDYRYMIQVSDITTPKKDDQIVDGSATKYIVTYGTDILGVFHAIVARDI